MKPMNIIIAIIFFLIGAGSGWIGSDFWDATQPPKILKQEITTIQTTDVTSRNEMNNYQVQETTVFQGLSNQQLIIVFTNKTGYSNLLKNIITNSQKTKIITNNAIETN